MVCLLRLFCGEFGRHAMDGSNLQCVSAWSHPFALALSGIGAYDGTDYNLQISILCSIPRTRTIVSSILPLGWKTHEEQSFVESRKPSDRMSATTLQLDAEFPIVDLSKTDKRSIIIDANSMIFARPRFVSSKVIALVSTVLSVKAQS